MCECVCARTRREILVLISITIAFQEDGSSKGFNFQSLFPKKDGACMIFYITFLELFIKTEMKKHDNSWYCLGITALN